MRNQERKSLLSVATGVRNRISGAIDRIATYVGESGVTMDESMMPTQVRETILALPPVTLPQDGAAQLLYNIAYDPAQSTHPLREVIQTLFNNRGYISSDLPPLNATPESVAISGMIETNKDGVISSAPIIEVFNRQTVFDQSARAPKRKPGAVFGLKAIQLVRT